MNSQSTIPLFFCHRETHRDRLSACRFWRDNHRINDTTGQSLRSALRPSTRDFENAHTGPGEHRERFFQSQHLIAHLDGFSDRDCRTRQRTGWYPCPPNQSPKTQNRSNRLWYSVKARRQEDAQQNYRCNPYQRTRGRGRRSRGSHRMDCYNNYFFGSIFRKLLSI